MDSLSVTLDNESIPFLDSVQSPINHMEAVRAKPPSAEDVANLAMAGALTDELEQTIEQFTRAMKTGDCLMQARLSTNRAWCHMKNFDLAMAGARSALQLNPYSAKALYIKGC